MRTALLAIPLAASNAFAEPPPGPFDSPDWEIPVEAITWICLEPEADVRDSLIESYFADLPRTADWHGALQILWENDGRENLLLNRRLIDLWAERNPRAVMDPLALELLEIASWEHFNDDWAERVNPPADVDALAASPVWIEPYDLDGFLLRIRHYPYETEEMDAAREAFTVRYEDVAGRPPTPRDSSYPDTQYPSFADVILVRECPLGDLPTILKVRALQTNHAAIALGYRRWAEAAPAEAFEHAQGEGDAGTVPLREIFLPWAAEDPDAVYEIYRKDSSRPSAMVTPPPTAEGRDVLPYPTPNMSQPSIATTT